MTPTIHHGDCLEVIRSLPDASIDAVVTDPPYALSFMGKAWDSHDTPIGFQAWCQLWAAECLRVLKPGGHLLAFGGTRTWHRLACAVEDAGFEVRDSIAWMYGSGFPKSLDVSKAIDKLDAADERLSRARRFQAWLREHVTPQQVNAATGTDMGHHYTTHPTQPSVATVAHLDMLRPLLPEVPGWVEEMCRQRTVESQNYALRPITQAEARPLVSGEHIAFDQRSSTERERRDIPATDDARAWQGWGTAMKPAFEPIVVARKPLTGTVAGNVLAHGTGALNIDGCRVEHHGNIANAKGGGQGAGHEAHNTPTRIYGDNLGGIVAEPHAGGRWPANVILDEDQAAALDQQSGVLHSQNPETRKSKSKRTGITAMGTGASIEYADRGGASRFYYVAKAGKKERPVVDGTAHPTVKPLALVRWLVRLVTPPGGTVLEPFAGSGTTVEACILEGFNVIAIEREADYLPLIQSRIFRAQAAVAVEPEPDLFSELDGEAS